MNKTYRKRLIKSRLKMRESAHKEKVLTINIVANNPDPVKFGRELNAVLSSLYPGMRKS